LRSFRAIRLLPSWPVDRSSSALNYATLPLPRFPTAVAYPAVRMLLTPSPICVHIFYTHACTTWHKFWYIRTYRTYTHKRVGRSHTDYNITGLDSRSMKIGFFFRNLTGLTPSAFRTTRSRWKRTDTRFFFH
jgi:hypothetical protein